MGMTDPVADMLTRIRNVNQRGHETVDMPYSRLKEGVAEVLKKEGYIREWKKVELEPPKNMLRIYMKYGSQGERIISKLERVSRPGRRVYRGSGAIEKVLDGLGISVVSTSQGVMSDRECRKLHVGGEVLCRVW